MADNEFKMFKDGPIKVDGPGSLEDHDGKEFPTTEGRAVFLCRCGASENKPFCDGSHKRVEFSGS